MELKKIIETLGWNVDAEEDGLQISNMSPAGENICFMLSGKTENETIQSAIDLASGFDIDEHVTELIQAKQGGLAGVPDVETLVEDAKEIQKMLNDLVSGICRVLRNEAAETPLRETVQELIKDDAFCSAFYRTFYNEMMSEGSERHDMRAIARRILCAALKQGDWEDMLIAITGYDLDNLLYFAEQTKQQEEKQIAEQNAAIDLRFIAAEIIDDLKCALPDSSEGSFSYIIRYVLNKKEDDRFVKAYKRKNEETGCEYYNVFYGFENGKPRYVKTEDDSIESLIKVLQQFAEADAPE